MDEKNSTSEAPNSSIVNVNRGKYDSLTLYEITDYELSTFKKGSPTSIYLNFSIFLLSIAISFLMNLVTGEHQTNSGKFIVFTIICAVGFIGGIILLILWFRNKGDMNSLCEKIEKRLPK